MIIIVLRFSRIRIFTNLSVVFKTSKILNSTAKIQIKFNKNTFGRSFFINMLKPFYFYLMIISLCYMVYGVTISILIQKHFFRIRNIWSVKMWVEG